MFVLLGLARCGPLTSSLTLSEQHKLLQTLYEAPRDLESAYFGVMGIYAIGRTSDDKDFMCRYAADNLDTKNAESLFQYSELVKTLNCKVLFKYMLVVSTIFHKFIHSLPKKIVLFCNFF